MNKDQMRSVLHNLTEEKAPASQINLLSAVQSRIQMSHSIQSKGIIMNKQTNSNIRKSKPAFIVIAIVIIIVIFFSLPEGRTLAQEILHFFTRGETNLMPGPSATPVKWVEQTRGVAMPTFTPQPTLVGPQFKPECGDSSYPRCSIDTIREMVDFKVFALPDAPEGMVFLGATGGSESILLKYQTPDQSGFMFILEEPFTSASDQLNWQLGADADIQTVQIGTVTGEYAKGSYNGTYGPATWDSDVDLQVLRWVNEGILFSIQMAGINPSLNSDDLAALAATLTDGPVGESGIPVVASPTPTAEPFNIRDVYPLSLFEAEKLSGFLFLTPHSLPETLTLIGASFDEKSKIVTMLYHVSDPNNPPLGGGFVMDGISLREQLVPQTDKCDLCEFTRGKFVYGSDNDVVPEDAAVETVQIGSLTGQYLEGFYANKTADISGWAWESDPFLKRLRFQSYGLAIEIVSEGYNWTKEDLITIAERLK